TMTRNGYVKRMSEDTFRSQNRGGKGIKGMQTLENDHVSDMIMASSHDFLMFFTNKGRVYRLKAYEIPESGRTSRGTAIVNLLELQNGEKVTSVIRTGGFDSDSYVFMATRSGMVKKTPMQDYANVRKKGLAAIILKEDDELIDVKFTDSEKQVLLVTKNGQCIRFRETDVRSTGRTSMGVIGIHLTDGDEVVAMVLGDEGDQILIVSENGYGKRTDLREFSAQGRGGKGVRCYKILEKTGCVIGALGVSEDSEIMLINTNGIVIRMQCADISVIGRNASGVKLMNITGEDKVSCVTLVSLRESSGEEDEDADESEDLSPDEDPEDGPSEDEE
nr:DNA gyrase subunit A [Lachnospiraceae bacterium]